MELVAVPAVLAVCPRGDDPRADHPGNSFTTYKLLLKVEPWGISPDLTRGKP
jgi:hypothetical protein